MKKLFIHKPLFRLLSPVFSGAVIYLLILLVNNNVSQLQEQFLGEELYVCIGLSYIVQEFSRILLILFKKVPKLESILLNIGLQIIVSLFLCIIIVSVSITVYYKQVLGFSPNSEELWLFNSVFSVVTLIYILLFISNQYLHKTNTEKLFKEQEIKQIIEADFIDFKQGINPKLLFESLEVLLILIQQEKNKADDFIDYLATIYRYILSSNKKQLVAIEEEIEIVNELINLFNYLPYRNIVLINEIASNFLTVPKSLLFVIEQIVRTTITSSLTLEIFLKEEENYWVIEYSPNDKITTQFKPENLKEIERVFSIYSTYEIQIEETSAMRKILLPKLTIEKA
ncbi:MULTISPECIES: histidine kinase [unclassified Tenacibaculum]|uniref:histidine kinase n=1 Tax=unclassified Tenacibaculum TaxID=2635139 RepID=UPI001F3122A1|nr:MULTISPECIES: histidine kinase [unclassified Tenacibaculum]MCF2875102.1 histidine kinase [Tenacibaculum sp. Cn5-1]MCF2935178.1 histidine kinase [Tenacibaculum sp. Cn5-34]MCG7511380.1 histidine kinase [Tenacibaculum sp. Cn5-46]